LRGILPVNCYTGVLALWLITLWSRKLSSLFRICVWDEQKVLPRIPDIFEQGENVVLQEKEERML